MIAVNGSGSPDHSDETEKGIQDLDAVANGKGHASYFDIGLEQDKVDTLRAMVDTLFFKIHGSLVTSLYNQKAIWPIFGYEGASYEFGGYIDRGYNDINWLQDQGGTDKWLHHLNLTMTALWLSLEQERRWSA